MVTLSKVAVSNIFSSPDVTAIPAMRVPVNVSISIVELGIGIQETPSLEVYEMYAVPSRIILRYKGCCEDMDANS